MSSAVEVLRDELNYYLDGKITKRKHNVQELTESLRKACLALEFSDCVEFGYWLVNAPNKEIHSKKWIEQKYQQYIKEKGVGLK